MRRVSSTTRFDRKLIDFVESQPTLSIKAKFVIDEIIRNPFASILKTHKLSGQLKECFASKINYKYRVIFILTDIEVIFIDIGSHDEVY